MELSEKQKKEILSLSSTYCEPREIAKLLDLTTSKIKRFLQQNRPQAAPMPKDEIVETEKEEKDKKVIERNTKQVDEYCIRVKVKDCSDGYIHPDGAYWVLKKERNRAAAFTKENGEKVRMAIKLANNSEYKASDIYLELINHINV